MEEQYRIQYKESFYTDLEKISQNSIPYYYLKDVNKINKDIETLKFMPRINKTVYTLKDKNSEYRRLISEKYAIIYKIEKDQIIIIRIFNQKQNYLNSKKFILKEKSTKYIIKK